MSAVHILEIDDWMVLFVDGKDKYQGHSMSIRELSEFCPIESIEISYHEGDDLYYRVVELGRFPDYQECLQLLERSIL